MGLELGLVVKVTTASDCSNVFLCTVVQNESLDALMRSSWCIMSIWIEPKNLYKYERGHGSNVSFRIGKRQMKL